MKKVVLALVALSVLGAVWFFTIRPHDIRVRFKVQTLPEIALHALKTWTLTEDGEITSASYAALQATYQMESNDQLYTIEWNFNLINDSTTEVVAAIKATGDRFYNRLGSLYDSPIKRFSREVVSDYFEKVNEHLDKFRVEIVGEDSFPETLCICSREETTQFGKAGGMMKNYNALGGVLAKEELKMKGNPIVEILEWRQEEDLLRFNFCFPIEAKKEIDETDFFYRTIPGVRSLRATYYGNYISSDRAWYYVKHFANRNKFEVEMTPIEVFLNNPNVESDETTWRADVFVPLRTKK